MPGPQTHDPAPVEHCPRCAAAMEWRHGSFQCPRCRFKAGCCEGLTGECLTEREPAVHRRAGDGGSIGRPVARSHAA